MTTVRKEKQPPTTGTLCMLFLSIPCVLASCLSFGCTMTQALSVMGLWTAVATGAIEHTNHLFGEAKQEQAQ